MDKIEVGNKYMFDNSGIIEIKEIRGNYYYFKIISGMNDRSLLFFKKDSDFASHLSLYEENIVCLETDTLIRTNGFSSLREMNDDLTYKGCGHEQYDIIKVYRPKETYQCQFDESGYGKGELVFDRERDIKPKFDCQKWIDDMFNKYMNDKNVKQRSLTEKTIIVYNTQNPNKNGVAICKDGDVFDLEIGIAVAYAKYLGETVPKEI